MGNRVFRDPSATFGLSFQKIKFRFNETEGDG
jgi:hypothetical protein